MGVWKSCPDNQRYLKHHICPVCTSRDFKGSFENKSRDNFEYFGGKNLALDFTNVQHNHRFEFVFFLVAGNVEISPAPNLNAAMIRAGGMVYFASQSAVFNF
jgi:hypothetical protein